MDGCACSKAKSPAGAAMVILEHETPRREPKKCQVMCMAGHHDKRPREHAGNCPTGCSVGEAKSH
jgi:hypothetical protein